MTRGTFGSIKLWVVSAAALTTNATVFGTPGLRLPGLTWPCPGECPGV